MSSQHRGMDTSVVHDASVGEGARGCGQARHERDIGDCMQRRRCEVARVMEHAW